MWKHFGYRVDATTKKLKNTGKAMCRLCKTDISHSGGMTNLWNHLRASHPVEYSELMGVANSETGARQVQQQTIERYSPILKMLKSCLINWPELKSLLSLSLSLSCGT